MSTTNLYNKEEFLAFKSLFEANVHSGELSKALTQIEDYLRDILIIQGYFI